MFESDFDYNQYPLAYLITVRTFGTWLHGDEPISVDRHGLNVYGRRRRPPNETLHAIMLHNMKQDAFLLNDEQRATVKSAIEGVCQHREYHLSAVNVRTNHFHVVVSAQCKPEPVADAFKSYATRQLRADGLIGKKVRPWARGKSRRYLWKPRHVSRAIDYVLYGQGDIPDFED
ncbi:MAG TPA: transposase [Pyrinomonadaceae bacterium]|nr:transposase [Pyrinomonadaceae bacterium]